jgi:hypothetical protein
MTYSKNPILIEITGSSHGATLALRCVNVLFSKICVESDDDFGGGRGVMEYALEAIPVRVEDGYYGKGASRL